MAVRATRPETDPVAEGDLTAHSLLKRGVHGIPSSVGSGQAVLGDGSGGWLAVDVATQAEQDAHTGATTNVHGIADTSKVMLSNVAQTRTSPLTITPSSGLALTVNPVVGSNGLKVIVPNNPGGSGQGIYLSDRVTDGGGGPGNVSPLFQLKSEGVGNGADLMNFGAGILAGVHGYSDGPLFQLDGTGAGTLLTLKMAENASSNPGKSGSGNFIGFNGYATPSTYADGVLTGTNLQSALATFVAEDRNKAITVSGITKTIAAFVDAHNVTLSGSSGLVDGAGKTFSYVPYSGSGLLGAIVHDTVSGLLSFTNVAANAGWNFTSQSGAAVALKAVQPAGGTKRAFQVAQSSDADAMLIQQLVTGRWIIEAQGVSHGIDVSTTANSGSVLTATKSGTGAGTAMTLNNAGTGLTLDVQKAGASVLQIDKDGNLVSTTTGIKIATATSQKLGFFNATPVVQQSAGVTATDATSTQTLANALRTALINLGLAA